MTAAVSPYVEAAAARIFHAGEFVRLTRKFRYAAWNEGGRVKPYLPENTLGLVVPRPWIWRREICPVPEWNHVCVQFGNRLVLVPPDAIERLRRHRIALRFTGRSALRPPARLAAKAKHTKELTPNLSTRSNHEGRHASHSALRHAIRVLRPDRDGRGDWFADLAHSRRRARS